MGRKIRTSRYYFYENVGIKYNINNTIIDIKTYINNNYKMSASNAAAIRRRVHNNNPNSTQTTAPPPSNDTSNGIPKNQRGLTIQQVISDFDGRIKTLEESAKTVQEMPAMPSINPELIDEYNSRFEIIANELAELKNIILKLQTFTMEVNKSLHDDRIRVLSEIEPNSNIIEKNVTYSLDTPDEKDTVFNVNNIINDNVNAEFLVERQDTKEEE